MATAGQEALLFVLNAVGEVQQQVGTQGVLLEQMQDDVARLGSTVHRLIENSGKTQQTLGRLASALKDSHTVVTEAYDALERRVAALETKEH